MSLKNYQYSLRNSAEERTSHLLRGRRYKSGICSDEIKLLKWVLRRELNSLETGYGSRHLIKKERNLSPINAKIFNCAKFEILTAV